MLETAAITAAVLTVVTLFLSLEPNLPCTIKIENSEFKGKLRKTWAGKFYCSFYGIPYATHTKRFEAAALGSVDWTWPKDFSVKNGKCLQCEFKYQRFVGQEDCLHLDIHTDLEFSNAPVFAWIHGGSFNMGSGQEDIVRPDGLIDRGIVVVTINYRLGPLGFFSHPNKNLTRNLGLRDQIVALKWIKRFINNFGGNNSDVTLGGWSAGGAAVTYHLYSSLSRGLFRKAVAMSGVLINPWAFNIKSTEASVSWCNNSNIDYNEPHSLQQLQEEILDISQYYSSGICCMFFNVHYPSFVPTKEDGTSTVDDNLMVGDEPHNIIHSSPKNDVPLLLGYTSLEETCDVFFTSEVLLRDFSFPNNKSDVHAFLEQLLTYEQFDKEKNEKFIRLRRIADMIYGIRHFADKYSENSNSPLYMYAFSLPRKFRKRNRLCVIDSENGAFHGDDIDLLFGQYFKVWKTFGRSVQKPQNHMWDLWANFIYYGDPTPNDVETKGVPVWPSYKESKLVMNINETLSTGDQDSSEMFILWSLIYDCLYYERCDPFSAMKSKFLA